VKLTTSRYFTPSGASIHGRGLDPDILEEGPGSPPADIGAADAPPLSARDADVRLGLLTLKSGAAAALKRPPEFAARLPGP
jgi:C-terminal processing protease CtpA/Prc